MNGHKVSSSTKVNAKVKGHSTKTNGRHQTSKAVVVKAHGHVAKVDGHKVSSSTKVKVKVNVKGHSTKTNGHHQTSKAVVVKSHGHVVKVNVHKVSSTKVNVKVKGHSTKTNGRHQTSKAVVTKAHGHVVKVDVSKGHAHPTPTSVFSPPPPMRRGGRHASLPQTVQPVVAQKKLVVTEMNANSKKMDKLENVITKMMLDSMNGNQQQLDNRNRLMNMNRVELQPKSIVLQNVQRPMVKPVINTQTTNGQTSKITAQTPVKSVINTQASKIETVATRPVKTSTPFAPVVPNVIPIPYKLNRYEHHHHDHNHHSHHNHHRRHHDHDDHDDHDDDDDDDDDDDHREEKWRERKLRFLLWKRDFFNRLRLSKINREHIRQRHIRHFH